MTAKVHGYGAMARAVRARVRAGRPVSALSFPQFERRRISQLLHWLFRRGELDRVVMGRPGWSSPPAFYRRIA